MSVRSPAGGASRRYVWMATSTSTRETAAHRAAAGNDVATAPRKSEAGRSHPGNGMPAGLKRFQGAPPWGTYDVPKAEGNGMASGQEAPEGPDLRPAFRRRTWRTAE